MSQATRQHLTVRLKPPAEFQYDKRKEGWELVEDVAFIGDETLEFADDFIPEGRQYVVGTQLLEDEKKLGRRCSQRHLERLAGQVADIPSELDNCYLLAFGTVWRFEGGLFVPYLNLRNGDERKLDFCSLVFSFNRHARVVRPCK